MTNAMTVSQNTNPIEVRSAVVIAAEINQIKDQTRKMVLFNAIEIGRRLVEAKQYVSHGEWGQWLQESVDFSQSTANNLMRIFEEYGSNQMALFGDNAKSEVLGNLSYTQAVALLAVPAEEREAFIEEHDVANKSSRELQKLIKEKQELEKQLKDTQEREQAAKAARELVSEKLDELQKEKREQDLMVDKLREELKAAQSAGDAKEVSRLRAEVRKAEKSASEYQKKLVDLRNELDEKVKQKEAELQKQMAEKIQEREREIREEAQRQIDAMKAELAKNNNVAAIKVNTTFELLTDTFKSFLAAINEVTNEEEQQKFKTAAAKLCDMMKEQL